MITINRWRTLFTKNNWWSAVATDRTRSWGLFFFVLMAIMACAYSVYLFQIQADWLPIIINSSFCLTLWVIATIMLYQLYFDKVKLEDQAWTLLSQSVSYELAPVVKKFYEAYQETRLMAHTASVALIIHLVLVSAGSVYIWLKLDYTESLDYVVAWTLVVVALIITSKLINDIANLHNNFKKAKGLKELLSKNKTI